MARIRTIKPEFFLHEDLAELSPIHRLLFVGLWTLADKHGRLEDRPRRIKVSILPWDEVDVDALLADLDQQGFIVRYEAAGKRCVWLPGFARHQKPHPKEAESGLPEPGPEVMCREISRQAVKRHSSIPSSPAGKGKEGVSFPSENGSGKESSGAEAPPPADVGHSEPEPESTDETSPGAVREVFDYWVEKHCLSGKAKLTDDRKRKVRARLREGYSVAELKRAVDGNAASAWHREQRQQDLALVCRDGQHVDRFIAEADSPRPSTGPPRTARDAAFLPPPSANGF